jgi:hypothetical protein
MYLIHLNSIKYVKNREIQISGTLSYDCELQRQR